jgi:very-short-patch-repair endonuclease
VPNRRFRLDIAFPNEKVAIEVDGFSHHGKYLSDFKRDRERQNLLTLFGWRILRYYAGEIHHDREVILQQIALLLGESTDLQ